MNPNNKEEKFQYLSEKNPTGKVNEDAFIVHENIFGVFDGATGLDSYTDSLGKTGGYIASNIAKAVFQDAKEDDSLVELTLRANQEIARQMKSASLDHTKKENLWCTTLAVVRMKEKYFEWVAVGDSPIILNYKDGTTRLLHYHDHDTESLILLKSLSTDRQNDKEPYHNGLNSNLMPQIIKIRNQANVTYGFLNGDPNLKNFIANGKESLEGVESILLITDGLLIPKEEPTAPEKFEEISSVFKNGGLPRLLELVRDLQDKDPECKIFIRLKQYDDATGVAFIA